MKFDPTKDHQKHRDATGRVSYTQNGETYTAGGKKTGNAPVNEADRKQEVRERASEKLAGFREDEAPGPIEKALEENRQAEAAEANIE